MQYLQSFFKFSAAIYLTTSTILFFFPTILHKKRKYQHHLFNSVFQSNGIVFNVAHRGGSRLKTQNTLENFTYCMQNSKPDILQMDVCLTKDKKLVVHHDTDLKRTCGINKKIQQCDFQELPCYSDNMYLDFITDTKIKTNNEKIPLLETVFQRFPKVPMNIQIKTPSLQAINQFNRLAIKYNRQSITFWGIRGQLNDQLKQINPKILTFFNDKQAYKLLFCLLTGLLPFIQIKNDSLQLPFYTQQYHQWKKSVLGDVFKVNAFFTAIRLFEYAYIPVIYHLRKRGIISMLWVCNTEKDFTRAIKLNPSGIMSDDPIKLQNFLNNIKQKKKE